MGRDGILPKSVGKLNRFGLPGKADMLVAAVSVLIPFVGRTAIGWIVDVTTLGATLIYGLVSAAALKTARFRGDKTEMKSGIVGVAAMIGFGLCLLLPSLFSVGSIEPESFFLFVVWSVLGFVFFRVILIKDKGKRFGKSIIVWIALLSLILFVSLVWMNQSVMAAAGGSLRSVEAFYTENAFTESQPGVVSAQIEAVRVTSARSVMVVVALFALALGVLLNNYRVMSKHAFTEKENEINEAIADGSAAPFALAVCDVNGLKFINDTLGHKAGDAHILKASEMICSLFKHSPVYRIGGDEFAVVLTQRDYENREGLLAALHELSTAHIASGDVAVSGGMASFVPGEDASVHDVFTRADQLMYQEKSLLKSMGAATR